MDGFTDCLPGAKVLDRIYGFCVYQNGEVLGTRAAQAAYQAGKRA